MEGYKEEKIKTDEEEEEGEMWIKKRNGCRERRERGVKEKRGKDKISWRNEDA